MKLPYLGASNPLLTQLRQRIGGQSHGRCATTPSPGSTVGSSRFRFQQPAPSALKGSDWQLQPLQKANAALTYEAYLTNPDAPMHRDGRCQAAEVYTWRDHIERIERAEQEHHAYKRFSFAVLSAAALSAAALSAASTKCLGCIHLAPLRLFLGRHNAPDSLLATTSDNTALVLYWICRSHRETPFAVQLIQSLNRWLTQAWELEGHFFCVNPADLTAVHTLQAAGLQLRFSLDTVTHPGPYTFFGD